MLDEDMFVGVALVALETEDLGVVFLEKFVIEPVLVPLLEERVLTVVLLNWAFSRTGWPVPEGNEGRESYFGSGLCWRNFLYSILHLEEGGALIQVRF
jgi:hypothetical protein